MSFGWRSSDQKIWLRTVIGIHMEFHLWNIEIFFGLILCRPLDGSLQTLPRSQPSCSRLRSRARCSSSVSVKSLLHKTPKGIQNRIGFSCSLPFITCQKSPLKTSGTWYFESEIRKGSIIGFQVPTYWPSSCCSSIKKMVYLSCAVKYRLGQATHKIYYHNVTILVYVCWP